MQILQWASITLVKKKGHEGYANFKLNAVIVIYCIVL